MIGTTEPKTRKLIESCTCKRDIVSVPHVGFLNQIEVSDCEHALTGFIARVLPNRFGRTIEFLRAMIENVVSNV